MKVHNLSRTSDNESPGVFQDDRPAHVLQEAPDQGTTQFMQATAALERQMVDFSNFLRVKSACEAQCRRAT